MNKNDCERRCIMCKKLLLNEKIPICIRCRLKAKDTAIRVGEIGGTVVGVAGLFFGGIAFRNRK